MGLSRVGPGRSSSWIGHRWRSSWVDSRSGSSMSISGCQTSRLVGLGWRLNWVVLSLKSSRVSSSH